MSDDGLDGDGVAWGDYHDEYDDPRSTPPNSKDSGTGFAVGLGCLFGLGSMVAGASAGLVLASSGYDLSNCLETIQNNNFRDYFSGGFLSYLTAVAGGYAGGLAGGFTGIMLGDYLSPPKS